VDISNIIYYTREGGKSKTLSLRELCLKDEIDLESVFHAVRDAVDTHDLLCRFRRISCDVIELDQETDAYIRFTVLDVCGNTNYLKFRKKKEK
jgi:hypothetical protein